jgi:hypothetical protein
MFPDAFGKPLRASTPKASHGEQERPSNPASYANKGKHTD